MIDLYKTGGLSPPSDGCVTTEKTGALIDSGSEVVLSDHAIALIRLLAECLVERDLKQPASTAEKEEVPA